MTGWPRAAGPAPRWGEREVGRGGGGGGAGDPGGRPEEAGKVGKRQSGGGKGAHTTPSSYAGQEIGRRSWGRQADHGSARVALVGRRSGPPVESTRLHGASAVARLLLKGASGMLGHGPTS